MREKRSHTYACVWLLNGPKVARCDINVLWQESCPNHRMSNARRWWQAGVEVSTHTCKLSFANEADSIAVLALCTGQASVFCHLSHLWLGEGAQWHEDLGCRRQVVGVLVGGRSMWLHSIGLRCESCRLGRCTESTTGPCCHRVRGVAWVGCQVQHWAPPEHSGQWLDTGRRSAPSRLGAVLQT